MNYIGAADWLIIGVYLLGIVVFGVWIGKGQQNTRDYFLGSKNIPWWGVSLSIIATETSALTFIGIPAFAYGNDLTFIQIVIGYVIARVILAAVLVPHYFKGEIYSPYQLLSGAFGPSARRTAGGFFLIAGTLAAGVRVYVTCIPIKLMLGIDILPAIVLFVVLSLIYTYVGGIKAVVWTDAIQFILLLAGGVFTLFYIPTLLEGGFSEAWREAVAAGKLKWLNADFSLAMPYNIWMGIIGATVLVMSSHGADQLIVQRVLACRNEGDGRKALLFSAIIILPLFLIFLLTGAMLWVYYQHHALAIAIPSTTAGFAKNDYIFPIFILTTIPPLLKSLLVVAILSAAMSSVSSTLSALASVSVMDFVKGLTGGKRSEDYYFRFGKYSTLFWAAVLILVAYLTREAESVLSVAFKLNGMTSGAMLGGILLAILWRRGSAIPVVCGMIVSLALMVWIGYSFAKEVAWPWYTLIGTTTTLAVAAALRAVIPGEGRTNTDFSHDKSA